MRVASLRGRGYFKPCRAAVSPGLAAGQAAASLSKGLGDGQPSFSARVRDRSAMVARPSAGDLEILFGPSHDLLLRERRKTAGVSLPRCSASNWAKVEPPRRPRPPIARAALIPPQVSPVPGTGPECWPGHLPWAAKKASAQPRICFWRKGGRARWFRFPRRTASKRAKLEPPRRPRMPLVRARPTASQVSPLPGMAPEASRGHFPFSAENKR